ncbi:MAG: glutamate--cysteine ligase, partial [Pseudomonadales bacterium]
ATLEYLSEIHQFVTQGLEDEILWCASMPCVLAGDNDIPLAQYGPSNLGRLKTTYRNGLGNRYGRAMQTICAVHYNFSFSDTLWQALSEVEEQGGDAKSPGADYISRRYFDLMRNFRRLSWLPVYLFGASPAVCNSFVKGRAHQLDRFDEGSLYARGATSLRSSNLGYQSDAQSGLIDICYNSLDNYVRSLAKAITTPHDDYTRIGLKNEDEYLQVNANILQSEAEFYTTIRAKRVPPKGANFLKVLLEGGVEYLEIRLLDVNPYLPLGIDATEIRFLDMLLVYCLLTDSPEHDDALCKAVNDNVQTVVWRGRQPDTTLDDGGSARTLKDWGLEVIDSMQAIAKTMDNLHGGNQYSESLESQRLKLEDEQATPSGRILADMRSGSIPFFRFAMNKALAHRDDFRTDTLPKDRLEYFKELATTSILEQKQIEETDDGNFDQYLAELNAGYKDLL